MASENSHTFYALEQPQKVEKALVLLGRLVANPRRPFDAYRPRRDNAEGDAAHEAKLGIVGIDIKVQGKSTISASAIKSIKAGSNLGSIFKANASVYKNYEQRLTSERLKTYKLEQYSDVFADIYSEDNQSVVRDFFKATAGNAYMLVSLRSAVNPQTEERFTDGKSAEFGIKVPLVAVTAGHIPFNILDPGVSFENSFSRTSAAKTVEFGEIVFAAEYCRINQETHNRFSLGKRTTTFNVNSISTAAPEVLAFGGGDDDDTSDEEEAGAREAEVEDNYI